VVYGQGGIHRDTFIGLGVYYVSMEAHNATMTDEKNAVENLAVGDTINVTGPDFLPKSDLVVTGVEHDNDFYDGTIITAEGNWCGARDYCFQVDDHGFVKTTNANGYFRLSVEVEIVEKMASDTDDSNDEPQSENTHTFEGSAEDLATIAKVSFNMGKDVTIKMDDGTVAQMHEEFENSRMKGREAYTTECEYDSQTHRVCVEPFYLTLTKEDKVVVSE